MSTGRQVRLRFAIRMCKRLATVCDRHQLKLNQRLSGALYMRCKPLRRSQALLSHPPDLETNAPRTLGFTSRRSRLRRRLSQAARGAFATGRDLPTAVCSSTPRDTSSRCPPYSARCEHVTLEPSSQPCSTLPSHSFPAVHHGRSPISRATERAWWRTPGDVARLSRRHCYFGAVTSLR